MSNELRTVLDDIDTAMAALDALKTSLIRLSESDPVNRDLALVHTTRALRYTHEADGLNPTRRTQATRAYKLGCAALSWGEAYTASKVRA
jgi:hypothetical protein